MGFAPDRVVKVEPTPVGANPYAEFPATGAPDVLYRVMDTPEQLREHVSQAMLYRGMSREELRGRAGVSRAALDEILGQGTGELDEVMRVLDALGVRPVTLPAPPAVRLGG